MNNTVFIIQQYITKILIIPLLAYAFLSYSCPTCQHRIDQHATSFFLDLPDQPFEKQTPIELDTQIELEPMEDFTHA